jgi:hypothetical protein
VFLPVEPLLCYSGASLDCIKDLAHENSVDPSKNNEKERKDFTHPVKPKVVIIVTKCILSKSRWIVKRARHYVDPFKFCDDKLFLLVSDASHLSFCRFVVVARN